MIMANADPSIAEWSLIAAQDHVRPSDHNSYEDEVLKVSVGGSCIGNYDSLSEQGIDRTAINLVKTKHGLVFASSRYIEFDDGTVAMNESSLTLIKDGYEYHRRFPQYYKAGYLARLANSFAIDIFSTLDKVDSSLSNVSLAEE